jgi:hypothetical protein
MKTLITETKEVKILPKVAVDSDDLVQGSVKKVNNKEFDYEMTQGDYTWWCEVQEGIDIANEKGMDTFNMEYEDYRNLL